MLQQSKAVLPTGLDFWKTGDLCPSSDFRGLKDGRGGQGITIIFFVVPCMETCHIFP